MKIGDIVSDPAFRGLPPEEQQKALAEILPGFSDLPQEEQLKGMAEMGLMQAKPKPQPGKVASIPELIGQGLSDPMAESLGMFEPRRAMQEASRLGVQYAPEIGLMAGGALPSLIPGGQAVAPITAGLGYYGGRMIKKALGEGGAMTPGEEVLAVPMGAAYELGGQATGALLGKAFAPVKSWYDRLKMRSEQARMIQEMVDQGIPISPDIQAPHPLTKAYLWITEKLPFGKSITDKYRWQTVKAINQMRDDFIEQGMKLPTPKTEEQLIALGETRKALYAKASEEAAGAQIPIPNLKATIEALPKEATRSSWWTKTAKPKLLGKETATFDDLNDLFIPFKIWGKNFDPKKMPPAQMAWREQLINAMKKDLAEFDAAAGKAVLKNYEAGHKFGEVMRGSQKSNLLERWLNDATDTFELQEIFNPGKFYTVLNKNKKILNRTFNATERQNIFNFAKRMEMAGQDISRLMQPKRSGLADLGAVATGMYFSPGVTVPLGFPLIAANSLMKPSGYVRRWLTSGLQPKTLLKSAEMGTKIGLMEAFDDND